MVIFDEDGDKRMTFVGPYREGSTMTLICDAFGGVPPPRVTWSRDGRLFDESYSLLANGTVRNEITFRNLDRSFLHVEFTCTASNTNLTRPTTSTVHLDMNCKLIPSAILFSRTLFTIKNCLIIKFIKLLLGQKNTDFYVIYILLKMTN